MARNFETYLDEAMTGLESGFLSEAARKRALESLNRAHRQVEEQIHNVQLAYFHALPHDENGRREVPASEQANYDRISALYYNFPALHVIKDKHFEAYAEYPQFAQMRELINLRNEIKAAEIVKHERPLNEEKVEEVRKFVAKTLEERKAEFVSGVELAHIFKGLHVSVNAHWVYGHKGARFIRYFFYLNGRFTALNMIMAIAEKYQADTEGK